MNLKRLALVVAISAVSTTPAYAQRYTATQNGEVIELVDTSAQMNVSVVWSMSNAWRVQPIENFFGSERTAIQLKKYALIDDVFTELVRDPTGRATMKLMYSGRELDVMLGPKYKTVLAWSTPLSGGGRGGGGARGAGAGRGGGQAAGAQTPPAPSGPFPVDPAQGVKVAPPAVPLADGAAAPTTKGFIAFEPMVAITNALNLAQKGVYKELQTIAPGGSWEESFWITTKGY